MTSGCSKNRSFAQRFSPISLVEAVEIYLESVVRTKTVFLGIKGSLSPGGCEFVEQKYEYMFN